MSGALAAGAQAPRAKLAVAGIVGVGDAESLAPELSQKLSDDLVSASIPGAEFVRVAPERMIAGDAAGLAEVRALGRALGVDKVVVGKALYSFAKPAPPPPKIKTVQRVETKMVETEYTEKVANPEYDEWQQSGTRAAIGNAAARNCGRGIGAILCGVAATAAADRVAAPPATVTRTVKTSVPRTVVITTQEEEPREDSFDAGDMLLRLRVMYAIVDVRSGNVERKEIVDYSDKVPEMMASMDSDRERKSNAVKSALPRVEDSIARAVPAVLRSANVEKR